MCPIVADYRYACVGILCGHVCVATDPVDTVVNFWPFFDLNSTAEVTSEFVQGGTGSSAAVPIPVPFPFGTTNQEFVYVSTSCKH